MKRRKANLSLAVLLAVIFFLGLLAGARRSKVVGTAEGQEAYDYLKTYANVIDIVKANYVDKVNDRDLIYASIKGMIKSLDPHSSFLTPRCSRTCRRRPKASMGA